MDFTSRNFDDPENIFHFINKTLDSLLFVLDWDTVDKFYYNLLRMSFGKVLNKPNKHSMVLAKPNESTYFHSIIPAFDIKYIQDCFDLKDFPDPTKYLIKSSCPVKYTKEDIVDCWIHRTKCWSDLKPIQKNDDDDDEIRSTISSDSCSSSDFIQTNLCISAIPKIHSNRNKSPDSNQICSASLATTKLMHESSNDEDDRPDSNKKLQYTASSSTVFKKKNTKTRLPYSHKEDVNIVKYIVKNNYAFNITGKRMWQNMERANVCKIRSWQSMKNRYFKFIKYELNSGSQMFPFLSKNDLKMLRQGLNIDMIKNEDKLELKNQFQSDRNDNFSDDSS